MKRNLATKLILAFTCIAVVTAALVAVVIWLTSPARLSDLVTKQQLATFKKYLISYYQDNGTLSGIDRIFFQVGEPFPELSNQNTNTNPGIDQRIPFVVLDENRKVVLANRPNYMLGMIVSTDTQIKAESIQVKDKVIGYILTLPERPGFTAEEQAYLAQMYRALIVAAVVAVVIALVAGILLASSLTRPLRDLKQAAQRMAGGQLEQKVAVRSQDEIGELGQAFNQMSSELARSNQLRRQMTADIAHDLRTPLTVIAGYIESMRDGVLAPSHQRLDVIYAEIERLQRLVEDLRTLSRAEAGELTLSRQKISTARLLQQSAAAFQNQADHHGVKITVEVAENSPEIWVDETRIMQVLGNLITNALRYTPQGGEVTLKSERDANSAVLKISDTGSGIAQEDLPRVFDRFYRGDSARSEQGGESGLGLAIARAFVQAHGGEISVESQTGQGSTFTIRLPIDLPDPTARA
ncbi:signal transduction histidine kinase [Longilinea arvoryzae]|uniref:histidine kinase n=1 Tax=Longilinea arvoryzae TaxID=360412 RepID=A0A0S7BMD7_9CHLR|nr:HAMP domain-containing sensor histidine kinase [Longilinea arvoryzae]GAP15859.1 signal transduction histidine kinase [Longilinea arvoryzae]